MYKADVAFAGINSDGAKVQWARENTKNGMWHFRVLDQGVEDWTTWMRFPENIDGFIREDKTLAFGKIVLQPITADKIRLPE